MTVLSEDLARTAGYLVSEASGNRSRDQITVASGSGILKAGAVLSRVAPASGTATASVGALVGTGNGALTLADPSVGAGVKAGVYKVLCVEPATDGGTFVVEDPDGVVVGRAVVGVAFTGDIKFTIADGSTDFAAGSWFPVTVAKADPATAGKYVPFDGSRAASAILYEGVDATSADRRRTATVRDSEVHTAELVWASGVTTDQKTAALASLATIGIIGR
ncbi:MAG: head decoration protein [Siculibacillus sp.]